MATEASGTHRITLSVTCPACQEKSLFPTWDCIDSDMSPDLRRRVLTDETLFFHTCPHCQAAVHVESPCLYIDRNRHYMVWHNPAPSGPVTSEDVCSFLGLPSFSSYDCRAVLTWGEWREKILEMDSTYDDRLYEIIKCGAYRLIKEADREKLPLTAYHIDYAGDLQQQDELALVFMKQDSSGTGYVYPISSRLKEVTADLFSPILERLPHMSGKGRFDRFGYTWAEHFLQYVLQASAGKNGHGYDQLLGFWIQTVGREVFQQTVTAPSL